MRAIQEGLFLANKLGIRELKLDTDFLLIFNVREQEASGELNTFDTS